MHRRRTTRNKMFQRLDYVAVLRPILLFLVWTLVLLRYHHGNVSPQLPDTVQPLRLWVSFGPYTLFARLESLGTPVLSAHLSLALTDTLQKRLRCRKNEDGIRLH